MRTVLVPALLALECIIAGLGLFLSPHPPASFQFAWLSVYLLVAFIVAYTLLFHARSFQPFPFIVLGVVLLNFFVQLTGGTYSFLRPAYFVFACGAAVFLPLPQTMITTGLILEIEAANMTISAQWDADRILVLDEGRLAGSGRHAELVRDCAVYREIVASQLGLEEDAGRVA